MRISSIYQYLHKALLVFCLAVFFIPLANAQTTTFTDGGLVVDVFKSNPCEGSNNGFIKFKVISTSDNLPAQLQLIIGPPHLFVPQAIAIGSSYTFNPSKTLSAVGDYEFIIADFTGTDVINTFGSPISFTALPDITITDAIIDLTNSDCTNPDGKISANVGGGSKSLGVGLGSFTYNWSTTNGLAGFPIIGTFDGTTTLDLPSRGDAQIAPAQPLALQSNGLQQPAAQSPLPTLQLPRAEPETRPRHRSQSRALRRRCWR